MNDEQRKRFRELFEGANWESISSRSIKHLESFIDDLLKDKDVEIRNEREKTIAKFVKWMRIENEISIVHKDQWKEFLDSLK